MSSHSLITYVVGDATDPTTGGNVMIAHLCNDIGAWGAGFVVAISKRWKEPEKQFRLWHKGMCPELPTFALGEVQFVPVTPTVEVANMIGQKGIRRGGAVPPIRYEALETALCKVADRAEKTGASVHMPRIGCGLAGGAWDRVEPLIKAQLSSRGIAVTVYDFPSR